MYKNLYIRIYSKYTIHKFYRQLFGVRSRLIRAPFTCSYYSSAQCTLRWHTTYVAQRLLPRNTEISKCSATNINNGNGLVGIGGMVKRNKIHWYCCCCYGCYKFSFTSITSSVYLVFHFSSILHIFLKLKLLRAQKAAKNRTSASSQCSTSSDDQII